MYLVREFSRYNYDFWLQSTGHNVSILHTVPESGSPIYVKCSREEQISFASKINNVKIIKFYQKRLSLNGLPRFKIKKYNARGLFEKEVRIRLVRPNLFDAMIFLILRIGHYRWVFVKFFQFGPASWKHNIELILGVFWNDLNQNVTF